MWHAYRVRNRATSVRGTGTGKPRRGSGVVCGGVAEAEVGVFGALLAVFVSLTSKIGRRFEDCVEAVAGRTGRGGIIVW